LRLPKMELISTYQTNYSEPIISLSAIMTSDSNGMKDNKQT